MCKFAYWYEANLWKDWYCVLLMTRNNGQRMVVTSVLESCPTHSAYIVSLTKCAEIGCVLLAMQLSIVLSGRLACHLCHTTAYRCPSCASSIILLTARAVHTSSFASAISNGLVRSLGIGGQPSRGFALSYKQVVRNDCINWPKQNGIVRVMSIWK